MLSEHVGMLQSAIWHTEEAIELQQARVISETEPFLVKIANRNLTSLEDLLAIQRRTLAAAMLRPESDRFGAVKTVA